MDHKIRTWKKYTKDYKKRNQVNKYELREHENKSFKK